LAPPQEEPRKRKTIRMNKSQLIEEFFFTPLRPVTFDELRDLTSGDRGELVNEIVTCQSVETPAA
jgi:hypothetical protein